MLLASTADRSDFVELDVSAAAWVGLLVLIVAMLAIDLFRHREAHAPTPREALIESSVWIACGLAFSGVIAWAYGGAAFGEYISGYLIEKSLSVDNVFVWSILFIFLGSALIARFWWLLLVFGVFLVFTGIKVIRHRADEGQHEATRGLGLLRRIMPVSDELDGQRFLTRIDGKRAATPLLAALFVIEITDVIFAVDSVPAILAVSNEPYLVFASNAFAILGMRALYFLLASAKDRFHYLSHALGGILVFVGLKMAVSHWYHLNTYVSLAVIVAMLAGAVVFSIRKAQVDPLHEATHAEH